MSFTLSDNHWIYILHFNPIYRVPMRFSVDLNFIHSLLDPCVTQNTMIMVGVMVVWVGNLNSYFVSITCDPVQGLCNSKKMFFQSSKTGWIWWNTLEYDENFHLKKSRYLLPCTSSTAESFVRVINVIKYCMGSIENMWNSSNKSNCAYEISLNLYDICYHKWVIRIW